MRSKLNKLLGVFLFFCFSITLIPFESFHHHDWESEICNEDEAHITMHSIDCDLAEFFISKVFKRDTFQFSSFEVLLNTLEDNFYSSVFPKLTELLKVRGPPELT